MLLGTDFPILLDLIQECRGKLCGVITRSKAKEPSPLSVLVDPGVESYSRVLQSVRPVSPLQLPEWLKSTLVEVGSSVLEAGTTEKHITETDSHMPFKQVPDPVDTLHLMPFHEEQIEAGSGVTQEDRLESRREQVWEGLKQSAEQPEQDVEVPGLAEEDVSFPCDLAVHQKNDPTLAECFKNAETSYGSLAEFFVAENGVLYKQSEYGKQLVLPEVSRAEVLRVGHAVPWAGHLGFMKTFMRISKRFYWPGMYTQVQNYCKTCPECQVTAGKHIAPAPLIPLPVISTPFERIGVDIVGPVERSQTGNKFILVICDYATRYLEAYPLREVTAKQVATALLKFFSQVGIPREVLTDHGPNFMSRTLSQVYLSC